MNAATPAVRREKFKCVCVCGGKNHGAALMKNANWFSVDDVVSNHGVVDQEHHGYTDPHRPKMRKDSWQKRDVEPVERKCNWEADDCGEGCER